MIDMHCHLDLYKNPISLLSEIKKHCEFVLAVTTSPRAWNITKQVFKNVDCIQVALGLHPEVFSQKTNEIDILLSNIPHCKFIGEIGMDGSSQYQHSFQLQNEFFNAAVQASEKCGGRIISIHSRNAVKEVLDIIENNVGKSIPILHWFSGSQKELERANELNCWFSVSPAMLSGKKGRSLVAKMPFSKILPETDGPFTSRRGVPYMPWEAMEIANSLQDIFKLDTTTIHSKLLSNARQIINIR